MDKGQKKSVHGTNMQILEESQKIKYSKNMELKQINTLDTLKALTIHCSVNTIKRVKKVK